jgi:succinate dehydrogenase/fumarate reductase flavoprotein subunit
MNERSIRTDVLVIGGGGAGLRAAIAVREMGLETVLLSKGPLARCGATPMAGADFTLDGKSLETLGFPGAPSDTPEKFFNDILTQGFYLNNQKLVDQYIRSAPARLRELLDWGMKVNNSEERAIFTSGLGLVDAVLHKARECGVQFLEDTMLLDLITHNGKVIGALGLDIRTGEFIRFQPKAVVMATGGWHKAFWPNTGMRDLSGEGIAIAHRAGAEIGNMEFITFCCNVLLWPPSWRGSIATYIMSLRFQPELKNSAGEEFLKKYDPFVVKTGTSMEWNKGFVSFASMREIRDGKGSPHGGVYFGLGATPFESFEKMVSARFHNWKYKALDLSDMGAIFKAGQSVEVGPAVEYFDGGIVVNETFETGVEGLFAAGECTLGPFGSNRVCSAITEMLVHGADAGRNAAEYVRKTGTGANVPKDAFESAEEKASRPLDRKEGIRPAQVRKRVQESAHKYLSPIRNETELTGFLALLDKAVQDDVPALATASKSRIYNKEWIDALELSNILHLLKCAALSALQRKESRGVHYREDYPFADDNCLQENILTCQNGGIQISQRPITVTSKTPPKLGKVPYLDMVKKMMQSRSDIGGHH